MTRFILILGFSAFATAAAAEGVVISGTWPNGTSYLNFNYNFQTRQEAISAGLNDCQMSGAYNCAIRDTFNTGCVATTINVYGAVGIGSGSDVYEANNNALRHCAKTRISCNIHTSGCDTVDEAAVQRQIDAEAAAKNLAALQEAEARRAAALVPPKPEPATRPSVSTVPDTQDYGPKSENFLWVAFVVVILAVIAAVWLDIGTGTNIASNWQSSTGPPPLPSFDTGTYSPTPIDARNPQAARHALELAYSYVLEVEPMIGRVFDDPALKRSILNTISLASKQLYLAQDMDPTISYLDPKGEAGEIRIDGVKSIALLYEGIARGAENPKHAIPIIEKAISLNPNNPGFYYWLGSFHSVLRNKNPAVEAFEKAVALDPNNVDLRKELDRAVNMAWSEIAISKTFRAGRSTIRNVKFAASLAVLAVIVCIVIGLIYNYGIANFGTGIGMLIALAIGAKIAEAAGRY